VVIFPVNMCSEFQNKQPNNKLLITPISQNIANVIQVTHCTGNIVSITCAGVTDGEHL